MAARIANQHDLAAPLGEKERAWEEAQAPALAQATKLDMGDYAALKARLSTLDNHDSYATSAAYYLMTCRKGLWHFQHKNAFVLFGWHPNVEGQILVFNPLREAGLNALRKLAQLLPPPPSGLLWARVQDENDGTGHVIPEKILDWVYPAKDLSTAEVSAHNGKHFRDLRKNLHRAEKYAPLKTPLSASTAFADAVKLINNWSKKRLSDDYSLTDLSDPQACILKLMRLHPHDFDGFMVYADNKPAGLCVWEKSDFKTAASFISVSDPDMRGLSDYIIYQMCDELRQQGKAYVCIGGSESAGLDAFKRKFNPAFSWDLQTCCLKELAKKSGQTAPIAA